MKNSIFKKQLIILISIFILIAGISTVSANENNTDLNQNIETYDNNVVNTNLEVSDENIIQSNDNDINTNLKVSDDNIIQSNNSDIKSNVTIDVKDVEMYYKNGTRLTGKLLDNNSNPVVNQTINIHINDMDYNRTTDDNGTFGMNINLKPAVYNFTVKYNGSDLYNPVANNAKVTVLSTIESNDLVKYYKNESQFYATFLDKQGNPLANNTNVTFNINGVFYTRTTNENGTATLSINLNPNNYIITVFHPNSEEKGYNITVLSTIESDDLVKYYKNESQFYATFLDGQGNPLANNTTVQFNINGVLYTRQTNENGTAKLSINLNPENYTITTINQNGEQKGYKITVLSTIESNDLVKYYKNESQFYATFLDKQGNPLANNTNVTFNINGVFYTRTTNENGTATLSINLNPGKYILTSFHPDGLEFGNNIFVNKTLITYDISQPCNTTGSATFNAQVLDGQGKPLSNASVTFSVSGKVLTKVTDDLGNAFINIKAYPGVYTITTSYNGYSVGNTLEIYNNNTGFKRYNLGSNDNGTVYLYKSIGNTSSNVRIAYIIGVHVTENAVHTALFDELTKKSSELKYCYDIYKINVTPIGNPFDDINRMRGQLLGNEFVVPEAIKNNYSLVVDVHSNQGGAYVITNFAFAPAQDNESKAIATKIINDNPGLSEYFPASQTSPKYVTLPIQKSGTPTIIYETYKFEDYNKITVPYVDLLIKSVDTMFDES